ncbi:MAG: WbqC family protein [Verrucomicrobiota bacterium]
MKVGIIQSNYIPWRGYFDLIDQVDLFVFHDDLQYTKNDWRNRNKILTARGPIWLTIPCGSNEKRLICEVEIADRKWQRRHWNQICANYANASFFGEFAPFFEDFFLSDMWNSLSELNQYLIERISREFLGSTTEFLDSRELKLEKKKGERVLEILDKVNAGSYLSGPAAKDYIAEEEFEAAGIELGWMDYSHYLPYKQVFDGYREDVSIVDLLFNVGREAREVAFGRNG